MTVSLLTLLLLFPQGLPPLATLFGVGDQGAVTGIVRRADTGQPLSDAQVTLAVQGESVEEAMMRATVTDRDGRFVINEVQPNAYVLLARREGFFKPAGDSPISTLAAVDVLVPEGQKIDGLIVEMVPGATISGRIYGSHRKPVPEAIVEALRVVFVNGRLTFSPVQATRTDDLGDYRMYWLPPGEYYVRARYRAASPEQPERYASVFFPGVADEMLAPRVIVNSGAEVSAVDFDIPTTPSAGLTVSGSVTSSVLDLTDRPIAGVYVVPADRTVTIGADGADLFRNRALDPFGGRFEIRGLSPGRYNLFPFVEDPEGKLHTERIPVELDDGNLEAVAGTLTPGVDLVGRVTLDGDIAPPSLLASGIRLISLDGLPSELMGVTAPGSPTSVAAVSATADPATGEFVFTDVPAGRYALSFGSPLPRIDAYLDDVRYGSVSAFDSGFTLVDTAEVAELVVRTQGGVLTGTVRDTSGKPLPRATVALVPQSPRRRNFTLYRSALSTGSGDFAFASIAPGEYKLFAWDNVVPGAWQNSEFLAAYEDLGVRVTVATGSSEAVPLTVISR